MKRIRAALRRRFFTQKSEKAVRAVLETLELRRLLSYTVNNLGDSASTSGTLRWAIAQAESNSGNQTIVFASSLTAGGAVTINLTSGPLELNKSSGTMTIQGPGDNLLTIDGSISNGNATVVLSGVTLQSSGGYNDISNCHSLTIANSVISGGTGVVNGIEYYFYDGTERSYVSASLDITDSTVDTSVINGEGSTAALSGVTVDESGGGVSNNGNLTVSNSTISGGTGVVNGTRYYYHFGTHGGRTAYEYSTGYGSGAGYGSGSGAGSRTTITYNYLQYRGWGYDSGSAIHSDASLTITNSTISDCDTEWQNGAGIANLGGDVNISGSTINNNSTYWGSAGGIFNKNGDMTITNSVITGNSSGAPFGYFSGGDGILNAGILQVYDSTISGNNDQGIANEGRYDTCVLDGTIVANNGDGDLTGDNFSGSYNLIRDASGDLSGSNNISGNPHLSTLGWYGGPTETIALLSGSAAIGAGHVFGSIVSDQRGFERTGTSIDIGAYQTQSSGSLMVNTDGDGSVGSGQLSLRDAVDLDNLYGAGTITFDPSIDGSTIELDSSGAMQLDNTSGTFAIDGPTSGITISAAASYGSNIFDIAPSVSANFDNLVLTGANSYSHGGAISNEGSLTLTDCTITGNTADAGGGAIYNEGGRNLNIYYSTITDNTANDGSNGGAILNDGTLTIKHSILSGNLGHDGGAIDNQNGTLSISYSTTIAGNDASSGGGIFENGGTVVLQDSTLSDNTATDGGAINVESGNFTITESTLTGNVALQGGAIAHYYNSATVSDSTFYDNTASRGGGIFQNDNGSITIDNSTLTENTATTAGGAILLEGGLASAGIYDSTIVGNTAPANSGGGIYSQDSYNTVIGGTIVANNSGRDLAGIGTVTGSYNLIGDGTGGLSDDSVFHNINGTIAAPINPELTSLGYYGGPTKTLALLPNSPAIGAGSNSVPDSGTDQRGFSPSGSYDIGAFYQTVPLVVNTSVDNDGPVNFGTLSLRNALTIADTVGGKQTITFSFSFPGTIDLAEGQLELTDNTGVISIDGPGSADLTINAGGSNRAFVIDSGTNAAISGLTITNGYSSSSASGGAFYIYAAGTLSAADLDVEDNHGGSGGAFYNLGTLNIANSTIDDNYSAGVGGAIRNVGTLTIANSTFTGNAAGTSGGAIITSAGAHLTISTSSFYENTAGTDGGAIYNSGTLNIGTSSFATNSADEGGALASSGDGVFTVTDSTFENNTAEEGAGIFANASYTSSVTSTITGSLISGNTAEWFGGGIYNDTDFLIDNCTISNNQSEPYGSGGGISNYGDLTIKNSSITGNSAVGNGGGIYSYFTTLTIENCAISGNTSENSGGGIFSGDSNYMTAVNSTITGNTAATGGGIFGYDAKIVDSTIVGNTASSSTGGIFIWTDITIDGSIVAQNMGGDMQAALIGAAISGTYNLIGDGSGGLSSTDHNQLGLSTPIDPLLAPLGYYGGPTETMPPLSSSSALAMGNVFDFDGSPITTDQRGFTRPQDGTSDIGAAQVAPDGPYILGSQNANTGATYTLDLFTGGITFDNWSINWGDGSANSTPSFSDGYVTHTYTTAPAQITIVAKAMIGSTVVGVANLGLDVGYGTAGRTNTTSDGGASAIAIQSNGDVVALADGTLTRYTSSGGSDFSFGASGTVTLPTASTWPGGSLSHPLTWSAITIGPNDQIAVAGQSGDQLYMIFYSASGVGNYYNNGSSAYFDPSGAGVVQATAISDADGEIAIVGGDISTDGATYKIVSVFNTSNGFWQWQKQEPSDGQNYSYTHVMVDPSSGYIFATQNSGLGVDQFDSSDAHVFSSDLIQTTFPDPSLATEYYGNIVVGGEDIEQYLPGGAIDNYFGSNGLVPTVFNSTSFQVVQLFGQSDGNTLVVGRDAAGDYLLARYTPSGTLDTTFADNGVLANIFSKSSTLQDLQVIQSANGEYEIVAIDPDGNIDIAEAYKKNTISVVGPPNVSLAAIPAVFENTPVTITATVTSGGGLTDAMHYVWTLTGTGSFTLPNGGITSGPSITFTPPVGSAGDSWQISLTVTDETDSTASSPVTSAPFTVLAAPLSINGPVYDNVGSLVEFSSTAESGSTFVWTATNGSATSGGSDVTFSFTPHLTGTWTLEVVTTLDGVSRTAYADLTVAYVPPTVSILGAPIGFAGHAMIFSGSVVQAPGMDDAISYAWSLNGPGILPTLVGADTANITVPGLPAPSGTDTSETYQLTLTITDDHDATTSQVTQTMEFLVLADPPSDGQFTLGAIPTMLFDDENATEAKSDYDFASAAAVLPDGDIAVTGWIGGSDAWDNYGQDSNDMNGDFGTFAYMPFLAMFNPDLTLDTNFGPGHTGIEPIANTISPDALDDNNGLLISSQSEGFNDDETDSGFTPIPVAMTINPLNGDIVVVGYQGWNELDDFGESDATSTAIPCVAEFLSTPKLVDGEMVPAGSMDPSFNQGYLLYVNLNDDPNIPIPTSQTWYGRAGSVVALEDGSILVGGEQSLIDNNGPDYSQDFLLFKLTSTGQLDSQFGELIPGSTTVRDGVAAHTWVMSNLYEANINSNIYATVKSVALQPSFIGEDDTDDDIIIAGYAGNPTSGIIDHWGDEYEGYYIGFPETDFVLQRYNSDGTLDNNPSTGFGPDHSGQVVTQAPAFDSSYYPGTNAWLGGMTVITSGSDAGDIVAAGLIASVPSDNVPLSNDYYGVDGNYTVGIAEYSPNGSLLSANLSTSPSLTGIFGPGAYGTFQFYSIGGDVYGDNVGEYTFNPTDGSVYVSINNYWDEPGSSWLLTHMYVDGTADTSFGPAGVATYTLPDTSWQITVPGALLWTDSGIYVAGQLTTAGASGNPQAQVDADPMVLRYNADSDSEITLTAAATPNNSISLTWTSAGTADAYQIEQKQNGSVFVPIATVGGGARSYVDSSVSADESYQYEIIPLNSDTSGALNPGSSSNIASVTSFSDSGAILVDTLSVPVLLTGDEAPPTSTDLYNGDQYLVVVSGTTAIAPDYDGLTNTEDYITDGAYWYAENTPSINGNTLDFNPMTQLPIPFGLGISGDQESPTTIAVPNWGAFDLGNHTYEYVVTGNGGALTLAFQSADAIAADYPTGTLLVQIYQLSSGTSSFSTAVRAITSPLATDGLPPTISGPTAVSIVSTAANSGSAPWQLWLVSSTGQDVKLASGDGPTGSLPMSGAAVVTIDPTRFTNGLYTLELTDGSGDLSNPPDAELISIQGIVKLGDLNQSDTDTTISSGGISLPVTRVYDSDQSNVAGPLGNGWSLNLLDSQLTTTESPEAYDPQQFASEVMRDGALIVFGGPTAGYNFEFEPEQNDDGTFTANFINVGAGPGDPGYGDTIKLVADATSMSVEETEYPISLTRDPVLNEYMYTYFDSSVGHDVQVAFNPANPDCHLVFVLTAEWNSEQYVYYIDPATGEVENYTANTAVWLAFSSEYNTLGSQLNSGLVYYPTVFDMLGDSLGTGQLYDNSTMSPGALISLTVPNGGNDIFEFDPTSIDQDLTGGFSSTSVDYQPNFISLTGSSDVLTVIADPSTQEGGNGWQDEVSDPVTGEGYDISGAHEYAGMSQSNIDLVYDATDNEFLILNRIAKFAGFDPSDPLLGLAYQLTTSSGYVYIINATTSRIESCTTTSGVVVYSVDPTTGNIVDGNGNTLLNIQWNGIPFVSQISSIQVPGQNPTTYQYDDGNLVLVTDPTGNDTSYSYDDSTNSHLLTGILNSLGISVLSAQYAPTVHNQTNGELLSVTDHNGITFPINYTLPTNTAGVRTETTGSGVVEEFIYDQYGNIIRAIQPLENTTDEDGSSVTSLYGYLVNVNNYTYATDETGNPAPGVGTLTVLQTIDSYVPLQITVESGQTIDPSYLRYFEQPLPATLTQETDYVTNGEFIGQVASTTKPLDFAYPLSGTAATGIDDNSQIKTINSNFAIVNAVQNSIKPLDVITEILTFTSLTDYIVNVQSISAYEYDSNGDLIESLTSSLQIDPSNTVDGESLLEAQGTISSYSGGKDITTDELIGDIDYQIGPDVGIVSGNGAILHDATVADNISGATHQTLNVYYQTTDGNGGVENDLEYSTNAAGQTTFTAYNAAGQTVLSYTYKTIVENDETVGIWFGTTSIYNDEDQLTDTYQAAYLDNTTGSYPHNLYSVGSGENGVNIDTSKNPVYSTPLRTAHYDYNDLGETTDMVDEYGGETSYIYDSNGNTIETISPNGSIVETVYDDQNRKIWETQPFDPAASSSLIVATHTIYNDLGQAVETDTYTGTIIAITGSSSAVTSDGTLTSQTHQFYNSQGQLVESDSASGLRTGTIYYPNGQTAYSGILKSSATNSGSDPWWSVLPTDPNPTDYFTSYTTNIYDVYDPTLNMFYNAVTDQNGNTVKTYQDGMGRTVRTTYADGSFTETLYSFGNSEVTQDQEGDAIPQPTWWNEPDYNSEVVTIAQRLPGTASATQSLVITYDVYDAANRLTDVYEPAVLDENPSDNQAYALDYGDIGNPHWTYVYDVSGNEVLQVSPSEQRAYQNLSDPVWSMPGATNFEFDDKGNQILQTLPDGESESWTYDQYSLMTSQVDFDGNMTINVYDITGDSKEGDLLASYYYVPGEAPTSLGSTMSYYDTTNFNEKTVYTYNGLGQEIEVQDYSKSGSTVTETSDSTYEYDAFGNVIESVTPEGTIHYVYDPATQEHIETYTADTDTLYGYDNQGRLVSVSSKLINGSTPPSTPGERYDAVGNEISTDYPTTLYTYDPAGNKLTETLPDGEVTTYTYDDQNRLIDTVETQGSTQLFNQQYSINSDGTRATSLENQEQSGGTDQLTFTNWTYDADDRLTGESVSDVPSSITMPAANTNGDIDVTLTWDGTGAFVSSGVSASAIIAGTADGMALLSPQESQNISGNANYWILCQSDGTVGDQSWSAFVLEDGIFEPVTVSAGGVSLPIMISIPENYNAFDSAPGAPTLMNGQLLLRWDGSAYVSWGSSLSAIISGQQNGIAMIPPGLVNSLYNSNSFADQATLGYYGNQNWLLIDSKGSDRLFYSMNFSLDEDGNFTADNQVTEEISNDLPQSIQIPVAYDLYSAKAHFPTTFDGYIVLNWDAGAGTYVSIGDAYHFLHFGYDGIELFSPAAAADGNPYDGNGSDWVLYITDGGQNGNRANWAELTFSLSNGTFTPDGFYTNGNGNITFTSTPAFAVGFASVPSFATALQTNVVGFTISSSNLNYSDTYTYDLDNNRMSEVEFGPNFAPSQTITYVYNGNDELLSQLTIQAGSTGFSYTDSTYDANGSMTGQYTDSPASNNSFGDYSETDATLTTDDSTSAASTGIGGTVITSIGTGNVVSNASILLPNGDILSVGYAYDESSNQDIALIAYNPSTGLPDTSFGPDYDGYVLTNINGQAAANAVTLVNNDGTDYILVAGYGNDSDGNRSFALVEYNLDGSFNDSFGTEGIVTTRIRDGAVFYAVTVLSDGDIVAAGTMSNPAIDADSVAVVEYDSSGNLMTGSFGTETTAGDPSTRCGYVLTAAIGDSYARSIAALSDGDILIAGYDDQRSGILAEYDSTGTLVPTFGSLGLVYAANAGWYAMSVLSDGNILVAGYYGWSSAEAQIPSIEIAEYSSDSHLVKTFGNDGNTVINLGNNAVAYAMSVLSDGTILLSGHGRQDYLDTNGTVQHQDTLVLVELNANGTPKTSFGDQGVAWMFTGLDATSTGYALVQLPDNAVGVVGSIQFSTGSQEAFVTECELGPQVISTYGYDVKNKLISYNDGTTTATYVYDDAGNRVAETVTTGGTSTTSFYLTDTENPTGYAQPLEVWTSNDDNLGDAALLTTYILGDRILGQVDSSGNVSYLLTDGHGSTQQMTDSEGFVTSTFSYDAFGTALNFDAATAGTQILFGGDAIYDPVSGLYMHGDGVRDTLGFLFIQMDSTQGSASDPISLHKYLYADANPVNGNDPSGYDDLSDEAFQEALDMEYSPIAFGDNNSGFEADLMWWITGSSPGRSINPVANPGDVETPHSVYVINDENFGESTGVKMGHSAIIIPNDAGCTYYSYAANGHVTVMNFNNKDDALAAAKAAHYTREEDFVVSSDGAAKASAAALKFDGTNYTANHNCGHMVAAALDAADIINAPVSEFPNKTFFDNESLADNSGPLP